MKFLLTCLIFCFSFHFSIQNVRFWNKPDEFENLDAVQLDYKLENTFAAQIEHIKFKTPLFPKIKDEYEKLPLRTTPVENHIEKTISVAVKNLSTFAFDAIFHPNPYLNPIMGFLYEEQKNYKIKNDHHFYFIESGKPGSNSTYFVECYSGNMVNSEQLKDKTTKFGESVDIFSQKHHVDNIFNYLHLTVRFFQEKHSTKLFIFFIAIFIPKKEVLITKIIGKNESRPANTGETVISANPWYTNHRNGIFNEQEVERNTDTSLQEKLKQKYVEFNFENPFTTKTRPIESLTLFCKKENMQKNTVEVKLANFSELSSGSTYWDEIDQPDQVFYLERYDSKAEHNEDEICEAFIKNFDIRKKQIVSTILPFETRKRSAIKVGLSAENLKLKDGRCFINLCGFIIYE